MTMDMTALLARFKAREITVAVVGLGYVGLPLCIACAHAGMRVVGFDVDPAKPRALKAGETYLSSIPAERVAATGGGRALRRDHRFRPPGRGGRDRHLRADAADPAPRARPVLCDRHRHDDRRDACGAGQLVVLESTTWPGTTVEAVRPILDTSGLECGSDYFLAFSPEREDPGNPDFGASNTPKVVGADDAVSRDLACALYSAVTQRIVPVSSTRAAEAVKLTENIFRAVNIAMVNEMKTVYAAMGIDIWEVIEAAKTKPFGYMPFYPGPGLGGHCIPIDPFYLTWKAREFDIPTRFIELAGEINTGMPRYVVEQTAQALDRQAGRGLSGARILLLGLAYKKNVNDMRESPAVKLIELFRARGAVVDYADPHVPEVPPMREHPGLVGMRAVPVAGLDAYDAAVIVTDHDGFDYAAIVAGARLVVDTRNACGSRGLTGANIVKA